MARQVAARLCGDDYQHLYTWFQVLSLLTPSKKVARILIEDDGAGSADDVTVLHEDAAAQPDLYHQVKYHVDHRDAYSVDVLTEQEGAGRSLLQKWFRSWQGLLASRPGRPIEIHIVSTWGWRPGDDLGSSVSGSDGSLKPDFFGAPARQAPGRMRVALARHLGASADDFAAFARCLRFHIPYDCERGLLDRAAERMEYCGLRWDPDALVLAVGLVRGWIKAGRQEVTRALLDATIARHDLRLPPGIERAVHVFLVTIKEQRYDIQPHHVLDWRRYFKSVAGQGGHDPVEAGVWSTALLPELADLERRINADTDVRLLRVRGLARLSAWVAFGYQFCDVNRYTLEVDEQGKLWRTDAHASPDFRVIGNGPGGEGLDGDGDTVAAGISVTGDLAGDVRRHLEGRRQPVRAVLWLRPDRELGRECLRGAGDAVGLADGVKSAVRDFVKRYGAARLLLYYYGPVGGACFVGHRLNAVCREIVVMERSEPTYIESFRLR